MSTGSEERLTRKERREQARADRKALEARATEQVRRRRLIQLGSAGGVAVIVIVIAVIVGTSPSGGGKPANDTPSAEQTAITAVDQLLAGIPQSGSVLGNPKAPVTLQYFGDLECPICRQFTLGALPALIGNDVRAGKLKIEYHSMETATHEESVFREQQVAALAAGAQRLMWYYVELFYHEQGEEGTGYVTPAFLLGLARQVPGLTIASWEEQRKNPHFEEALEKDKEVVGERGFPGTPSFLIARSGGTFHKLEYTSNGQLERASELFEPEVAKLLKG